MTERTFPKRTIHLDFHNGPSIAPIGEKFDAERFADRFAEAEVDSVTVFAKCHHGHLYYDTERPERHPGLVPGLDLLGAQVDALHARGIRAPIYFSVQCDEYAADTHPEWIAMDGKEQVKRGPAYGAGWQIMDMSSPYQDYLAEQVSEVIERFAPLDGLFLDMCWDQPSSSVWARRGMKAEGLDPAREADRATYARLVAHRYMERFSSLVTPHLGDDVAAGVWFNSRSKTALGEESKYLKHVEIEALPTGGWGYSYFPYTARFVRPIGLPTLSHTGRFHKSWGDNGGLKPPAALLYETSQILAQGMTVGVGDVLAPSGEPSRAVYRLIGDVYRHVKACEPALEGTTVTTEAAIVVDPALGSDPGSAGIGAMRLLQQLRVQFDIIGPGRDLSRYQLLVVPETTPIDAALADQLTAALETGRSVLVSRSGDGPQPAEDELAPFGIRTLGPWESRFAFLRSSLTGDDFDHAVYHRGIRVDAPGAEILSEVVEPYFVRTWDHFSGHSYSPSSGRVAPFPAIVAKDRLVVLAAPLLKSVAADAAPVFRRVLRAVVDRLLPEPLVRVGGPVHLETSLATSPTASVLHLISFIATRVSNGTENDLDEGGELVSPIDLVEDPFPLIDVPIQIRVGHRPVSRVTLEPAGTELAYTVQEGYLHTSATVLGGHAMVVVSHSTT